MSSVAARASASGWWRAIHCSLKPGQATEGGLAVQWPEGIDVVGCGECADLRGRPLVVLELNGIEHELAPASIRTVPCIWPQAATATTRCAPPSTASKTSRMLATAAVHQS